jgi:seryl-tRNA synthetase
VIDWRLLQSDFDETARRLGRKGVDASELRRVEELVRRRQRATTQLQEVQTALNQTSREIGEQMRSGRREQAEAARQSVATLKAEIGRLEEERTKCESELDFALLRIPNLPDDESPEGRDETANVVRSTHGYDAETYRGKAFRPHWEVATDLGIYDAERAGKISGAMFALLRGAGARLLRALVDLGIRLNADRYEEILPPHLVRTETLTATGHLPKFEADAFRLRDDDLWAISTGEVPLTGLHRDEILALEDLPRSYMAYTVCFRREAGSAGRDTRGMQRLHEFHKVELVKICAPEQAKQEFAAMLGDARRPLELLGLPYRIVDLCAGDLPFSSARVFDLEVYAPGVDKWLEVSSVGNFTDFQARRGNIRFRRGDGKLAFPHLLNGSALATPRVWAALIEHGQQPDGSVLIPEPLRDFMQCDRIRAKG